MSNLRVAGLALIAAASFAVPADGQAKGPFKNITTASNQSSYSGKCPVNVIFTGNIVYNLPLQDFTFSYYWAHSGGGQTAPTDVDPRHCVTNPSQVCQSNMLIVHQTWQIGKSGTYTDTLFASSGSTNMNKKSAPVKITCK
jgi:hypothetical protein